MEGNYNYTDIENKKFSKVIKFILLFSLSVFAYGFIYYFTFHALSNRILELSINVIYSFVFSFSYIVIEIFYFSFIFFPFHVFKISYVLSFGILGFKILLEFILIIISFTYFIPGALIISFADCFGIILKNVITYEYSIFPAMGLFDGFQFFSIRGFILTMIDELGAYDFELGIPVGFVHFTRSFIHSLYQIFWTVPYFVVFSGFEYGVYFFNYLFIKSSIIISLLYSYFPLDSRFFINPLIVVCLSLLILSLFLKFIFFSMRFKSISLAYYTYSDLFFNIYNLTGFNFYLDRFFSRNRLLLNIKIFPIQFIFSSISSLFGISRITLKDFVQHPSESLLLMTDNIRLDPKRVTVEMWLLPEPILSYF